MHLNLIFHNIVQKDSEINNTYTLTVDYLLELIEEVETSIANKSSLYDDYRIYFDDGYKSFMDLAFPKLKNKYHKIRLALISDNINKIGFLSESDIRAALKAGVKIASHGVSHAALAIYRGRHLQPTPLGGEYVTAPFGQGESLFGNQVLYQFFESRNILQSKFGVTTEEFVFPYGLYNDTIIALNQTYDGFSLLSTCNEYLDGGQPLRPRFLVSQDRSVTETINIINKLNRLNVSDA